MNDRSFTSDPNLDLVLERRTHVPVDLVWKALTTPELVKQWFCPRPWMTTECAVELWPGGKFLTVMESPDGDSFRGEACVLEVVEKRRFVWTSGLLPGFRPKVGESPEGSPDTFLFTAIIELECDVEGTMCRATVVHGDEEARRKHESMGFESGWGAAFDQLVELMS